MRKSQNKFFRSKIKELRKSVSKSEIATYSKYPESLENFLNESNMYAFVLDTEEVSNLNLDCQNECSNPCFVDIEVSCVPPCLKDVIPSNDWLLDQFVLLVFMCGKKLFVLDTLVQNWVSKHEILPVPLSIERFNELYDRFG